MSGQGGRQATGSVCTPFEHLSDLFEQPEDSAALDPKIDFHQDTESVPGAAADLLTQPGRGGLSHDSFRPELAEPGFQKVYALPL